MKEKTNINCDYAEKGNFDQFQKNEINQSHTQNSSFRGYNNNPLQNDRAVQNFQGHNSNLMYVAGKQNYYE